LFHSEFDCNQCTEQDGERLDADRLRRVASNEKFIHILQRRLSSLENALRCAHPCRNPPQAAREALLYLQERLADLVSGEPEEVHMLKANAFLNLKDTPSLLSRLLRKTQKRTHSEGSFPTVSSSFSIPAEYEMSPSPAGIFAGSSSMALVEVASETDPSKQSHELAVKEALRVLHAF